MININNQIPFSTNNSQPMIQSSSKNSFNSYNMLQQGLKPDVNSNPKMLLKHKRRSRYELSGRNNVCHCGQSYLSSASLLFHKKLKHNYKGEDDADNDSGNGNKESNDKNNNISSNSNGNGGKTFNGERKRIRGRPRKVVNLYIY